jgi:hypothetical protein
MIDLENIRVTGLTFKSNNSSLGKKQPVVLVIGLTKDMGTFAQSYNLNQVRETLSFFAKEYRNEIKQTTILLAMLVMLGEDVTEEYLCELA